MIDKDKADRIFKYFYNPIFPSIRDNVIRWYMYGVSNGNEFEKRFHRDPNPIPERLEQGGLEVLFALHGLIFTEFSFKKDGKVTNVPRPKEDDAADLCLDYVIRRYRKKVAELRKLAPASLLEGEANQLD